MSLDAVILGIVVTLLTTELWSWLEPLALAIARCAGVRAVKRGRPDHTEEWVEDIKHRPGQLLKAAAALWLFVSAILPVGWTTLNLPSLLARLSSIAMPIGIRLAIWSRALARLGSAAVAALLDTSARDARGVPLGVRLFVALLPRHARSRYREELTAEWCEIGSRHERMMWNLHLIVYAPRIAILLRRAQRK